MVIEPDPETINVKTQKKMELAIKLCKYSDEAKQIQYKGDHKEGSSITACGYTAPLMAIVVMFLDNYNITDLEMIKHMHVLYQGECRQLDLYMLTHGINQCVGYLWNLNLHKGVGIDALILNKSIT